MRVRRTSHLRYTNLTDDRRRLRDRSCSMTSNPGHDEANCLSQGQLLWMTRYILRGWKRPRKWKTFQRVQRLFAHSHDCSNRPKKIGRQSAPGGVKAVRI